MEAEVGMRRAGATAALKGMLTATGSERSEAHLAQQSRFHSPALSHSTWVKKDSLIVAKTYQLESGEQQRPSKSLSWQQGATVQTTKPCRQYQATV